MSSKFLFVLHLTGTGKLVLQYTKADGSATCEGLAQLDTGKSRMVFHWRQ
jgi:hypothetical protein